MTASPRTFDTGLAAPDVELLSNGLTVACLIDEGVDLVSTALWCPVGAAHEDGGREGIAHFLEHMMFKGARRFGPGEIDRRTLAVGGSNNAFTSHDSTVYLFDLPREHWRLALEIEADRMAGPSLDPGAVAAERQVILEEIGEAENDPWDALETAVLEAFFDDHPYGRRILGRRADLMGIEPGDLRRFHRRACAPQGAVLTVAGAVPKEEVFALASELFGALSGPASAAPVAPPRPPVGLKRIRLERGDVRRGLLALPSPAAPEPAFAHLRLALTALAGGRASPLQRRLLDEGNLCRSLSSALTETVRPGMASLAIEALPGTETEEIERVVWSELEKARRSGLEPSAVERARRLLIADWLFSHETIGQRGGSVGIGLALFGADYPQRHRRTLVDATVEDVSAAARRYLAPERSGVIGWSGR